MYQIVALRLSTHHSGNRSIGDPFNLSSVPKIKGFQNKVFVK